MAFRLHNAFKGCHNFGFGYSGCLYLDVSNQVPFRLLGLAFLLTTHTFQVFLYEGNDCSELVLCPTMQCYLPQPQTGESLLLWTMYSVSYGRNH